MLFVLIGAMEIYIYLSLRKILLAQLHGSLAEPTRDTLVTASAVIAIAGLFVYAVLLVVCCVLQLTFVLGFMNIILFPVILLVLAVFFLRDGHEVEIV